MARTRAMVYQESTAPLSESELQQLLDAFTNRFDRLNDEYLDMMGKHIRDIGEMIPSDVHRLQQMRRMTKNFNALEKKIARAANLSVKDLEKLMNQCAARDARYASKILGVKDVGKVGDNAYLQRILEAQYRETAGAMQNLSNTTAVRTYYKRAIDEAVTAVQSGVEDYNTSIRRVVREAGQSGLRVTYESGYSRRLDSAARMNVLDGTRHLNQNIMNAMGEKFGADGVEIDAHMLCAEDHMPYQGQQYSNEEFMEIQDSLQRPFGEWNCRHSWHPILMGISAPAFTDDELDDMRKYSEEKIDIGGKRLTRYEWSQEMRRIETGIRAKKDTANLARASGDTKLRRECQNMIRGMQDRYRTVAARTGLETQYSRQFVDGFKDAS